MPETQDGLLRQHLLDLLKGGGAHAKFEDVIAGFPAKFYGRKPEGLPHSGLDVAGAPCALRSGTFWSSAATASICHRTGRRVTGRSRNASQPRRLDQQRKEVSRGPPGHGEFGEESQDGFVRQDSMGRWSNRLREALLIADHSVYRLAQFVDLRRLLGIWPPK